ncbi:Retrovirus-related Pol polyprotein from transposon 297 [Vitis vinifera]|uniref:Retrovirus-related Pol polyprotein from transposon 297 n=1 Tax=Vitis vinifera TaxID=29760 RepID=A0A438BLX6_VITVI|nr:Retrovirus-related Pol polyprotein from transposon 297 [Vitis vinifera]
MESENPYSHIKEFEEVCNTFQEGGASIDLMRLKLFPFTLKDKAKIWLNSLRPGSIRTWIDFQAEFLKKFFPTHRTNGLKRQISNFSAKENEKFYECWERYMETINACPHHGFDTWLVVSYFLLWYVFFNEATPRNYVWRRLHDYGKEIGRARMKKVQEVQAISETSVQAMPWFIFQSYEHLVEECPTIPVVREMFGDQANCKRKESFLLNLIKIPRVSMKWRLKRENLQRKEKGKSTEKDYRDSNVDEEPERIVIRKICVEASEGQYSFARHDQTMSTYAKFLKDLCTIKKGLNVNKKAFLTEQVSVIIQCKSPVKYKDPGCPTILVSIGGTCVEKALLDLGASVNLLPYSVYKQLGLRELKPTSITLSLADRSVKIPRGMIEDVLVQVDKFYYPVDFVVLDTDPVVKGTNYVPIILGRPFRATSNAIINCRNGVMQLTFGNMTLELNIFHLYKKNIHLEEEEDLEEVCMIDTLVDEHCDQRMHEDLIESFGDLVEGLPEPSDLLATLLPWRRREEILPLFTEEEIQRLVKEEPPKLILKPLLTELKYAYLEDNKKCHVVISSTLTIHQQDCLLEVLKHDEAKPFRQPQRKLNPHMQEVVRAEVLKLLQAGIIYPISDSPWVSPTQVVPKKSGITVVQNDKGEEVSTRLTTSWRVCIDYRRLNAGTRKDHFPLPPIDQIEIDIEDQEKTTFTCPFGTYAYRRMPFGLCNAPTTFQRCMLSIFSDMVECIMEVFMDDITIYGMPFHGTPRDCPWAHHLQERALNWQLPFEVICDGSDFAIGAVLGKREDGKPYVIYYAIPCILGGFFIVVFTDHFALKYLLTKQDAKVRLIRWILLLQEFNLQIKDKKGVENVVADHLSRLAIAHNSHGMPINDDFLEESLMLVEVAPWYAHIVNYLVT